MRPFVILGLATLVAGACKDAAGPKDTASLGRGLRADLFLGTTVSILDALGAATPTTQFSVFGAGGSSVLSFQFVGPEFVLTQPTTIMEIGGFLNNCKSFVAGVPQCPGTLPFVVQIRPENLHAHARARIKPPCRIAPNPIRRAHSLSFGIGVSLVVSTQFGITRTRSGGAPFSSSRFRIVSPIATSRSARRR